MRRETSGADVPDGLETGDISAERNKYAGHLLPTRCEHEQSCLPPAKLLHKRRRHPRMPPQPSIFRERSSVGPRSGRCNLRALPSSRYAFAPLLKTPAPIRPATSLTDAWVDSSGPSETRYPTLREAAVCRSGIQHLPSAAVPTLPVSSNLPIPTPAKARVRAHRLRDLPARGREGAPVPWGEPSTAPDVSPPTLSEVVVKDRAPQSGTPQRDWIYEIATALADECDLRGLDA